MLFQLIGTLTNLTYRKRARKTIIAAANKPGVRESWDKVTFMKDGSRASNKKHTTFMQTTLFFISDASPNAEKQTIIF